MCPTEIYFGNSLKVCLLICSALAFNVPAMLVGRFLVGAGLGLSGPVTSLYISEVHTFFSSIHSEVHTTVFSFVYKISYACSDGVRVAAGIANSCSRNEW